MTRLATALALLALVACDEVPTSTVEQGATPSFSAHAGVPASGIYRVTLDELNASGVTGTATLQVRADQLIVTLNAVGHVPEQVHAQHIHGFADQASACPTAAQDADGDGVITVGEGAVVFGPVQVELRDYPSPTNSAGAIQYRRAFDLADVPFDPADLSEKAMVLHGAFLDGAYVGSLPVACGKVEVIN
jgi:hypothetical protein